MCADASRDCSGIPYDIIFWLESSIFVLPRLYNKQMMDYAVKQKGIRQC